MSAPLGDPPVGAAVLRVPDTAASVELDGETVVYDETRRRLHVLNPTATMVWHGIDGRTSLEQIAQELSEAFGADLDVVRHDVLELAADLVDKGLVLEATRGPDPGASDGEAPGRSASGSAGRVIRFLEEPPSG